MIRKSIVFKVFGYFSWMVEEIEMLPEITSPSRKIGSYFTVTGLKKGIYIFTVCIVKYAK